MSVATILKPLYKVRRIDKDRKHYYEFDGDDTWHPGVTGIIGVLDKPALIPWAAKSVADNILESLLGWPADRKMDKLDFQRICEEGKNIYKKKSQAAADVGTRVHKAIDDIIHGREPKIEDDTKDGIQGFIDWKASHSLKIELGDTKIGSKLFGYGGSLDFVAFEGSEAIIFDLKTTKKRKDRPHGIYDEYAIQLAAYRQAFTETYGIPVKDIYALWVNKEKPEFKPVRVAYPSQAFEQFLACMKIYKGRNYQLFEEEL